MRAVKNIFSRLHLFVLWLLASAIFWGWIFTLVTDTVPAKKVTVYCRVPEVNDRAMAVALEENMPDGLRMIQVHPFDYVMFDTDAFDRGDVFIVPASEDPDFVQDLLPLEGAGETKVHDAETGAGAAASYIQYGDEDYYMYLGSGSVHLDDGAALAVAREILALP